jgi:ribonuclease HII
MNLYEYDKMKEVELLCGVDEAGRGPLAGEVYAGAVILDPKNPIEGLNDSKKLSEKKREFLYDEIVSKALAFSIATATVNEIDEINILQATFLAMRRAVDGLSIKPEYVLVDGNQNPRLSVRSECVIKGDATSASIAAASILAKVARDRYMKEMAKKYPEYLFEKHKGYGTALHYEKLKEFGISEIHRKTFLKRILGEDKTTQNQKTGKSGEETAKEYLQNKGYDVITMNFHSKMGEIDIIATDNDNIVFVEVKTKKKNSIYTPVEAVTKEKQKKIIKTAVQYAIIKRVKKQMRFDIIEIITNNGENKINHIINAFDGNEVINSYI